jgi:2,4-diaminopentanoate dehydrogenase
VKLLAAGINVVTTTATSLVYPATANSDWRTLLTDAAVAGQASLHASGIFPGFASDYLALIMATQSNTIRTVRVTEVSLNDQYPVANVMMDGMGFGRPLDFEPLLAIPGVIESSWQGPIHLIAEGLGVVVTEVRGSLDRATTD